MRPAGSGARPGRDGQRGSANAVSHPWRTTRTCLASSSPAPRIAPARGAPPSSSSPVVRAVPACTADTPAANAPTNTAMASSTSARCDLYRARSPATLVGHRLRARRVDRAVRQDPRLANQRQTGGPSARNALRPAGDPLRRASTSPRCTLGPAGSARLSADSNPLRYGISPSNELSRLRSLLDDVEDTRIPARRRPQLDSGEFAVTGSSRRPRTARRPSLHETRARGRTHLGRCSRGCRRALGARPALRGRAAVERRIPPLHQFLDRAHVDAAVVQVLLDLGQVRGEEPAIHADRVAAQRHAPRFGDVRLDERQGLGARRRPG